MEISLPESAFNLRCYVDTWRELPGGDNLESWEKMHGKTASTSHWLVLPLTPVSLPWRSLHILLTSKRNKSMLSSWTSKEPYFFPRVIVSLHCQLPASSPFYAFVTHHRCWCSCLWLLRIKASPLVRSGGREVCECTSAFWHCGLLALRAPTALVLVLLLSVPLAPCPETVLFTSLLPVSPWLGFPQQSYPVKLYWHSFFF